MWKVTVKYSKKVSEKENIILEHVIFAEDFDAIGEKFSDELPDLEEEDVREIHVIRE